jgi:hypothetical protein
MSHIQPKDQRELHSDVAALREFMTPEELSELDRLTWNPEKERLRFRHDPPAFAREVLGMDLTDYQEDALWKLHDYKRVTFRGPRGAGKSTVGAAAVLWFLSSFEECKVPTTASAWRQLIAFLWPEIHKWAKRAAWWKVGLIVRPGKELLAQSIQINGDPNRSAFAMASSDSDKIEGAHSDAVLMVFDESKAIPDSIWDSAEGALGTGKEAYAFALSTPGDNVGRFYDIQTKRDKFPHWKCVSVTLEQCVKAGRILQSWADMMKTQWGAESVMYKRQVLGQFAEDTGDTLISLSMIERAVERWHALNMRVDELVDDGMEMGEAEDLVWGELSHIGCDPARFGADRTGWALRFGQNVRSVSRTEKEDTMETAGRLVQFMRNNTAVANIDVNGLGAGVYDRIRELWTLKELRKPHDIKLPAAPINTANATKNRDRTKQLVFNRLRDYLWWNIRELLEDDAIALPPDDELLRDLVSPKWTTTSSGKVVIESKDEIRKRLGRSTDVGDATVMALSPDVLPYKPQIGFV